MINWEEKNCQQLDEDQTSISTFLLALLLCFSSSLPIVFITPFCSSFVFLFFWLPLQCYTYSWSLTKRQQDRNTNRQWPKGCMDIEMSILHSCYVFLLPITKYFFLCLIFSSELFIFFKLLFFFLFIFSWTQSAWISNGTLQKVHVLLLFLVFLLFFLNASLNISTCSSFFPMLLRFLSPSFSYLFYRFPSSFFPFLLLLLYVVHCPRHEGGESTSNAPLGKSGKIRRRRQSWLMQCCTPRHCSSVVDTQQTQCGNNKTAAMWQYGAMWQYTSKRQQIANAISSTAYF